MDMVSHVVQLSRAMLSWSLCVVATPAPSSPRNLNSNQTTPTTTPHHHVWRPTTSKSPRHIGLT